MSGMYFLSIVGIFEDILFVQPDFLLTNLAEYRYKESAFCSAAEGKAKYSFPMSSLITVLIATKLN